MINKSNSNEFKSILLLKIPFCRFPDSKIEEENFRTKAPFRPIPSLALATLCGFLKKYKSIDYKINAIDVNIEAYTKPGVAIDYSAYPKLLEESIKNNSYDVLALSSMFVFNVKWVDIAVRLSRKYHPNAKIIIGGGYPTLFPERCLKEHEIDDVVIGEGEATLLHLLNKYNKYHDSDFEEKFPFVSYATKNKDGEIQIIQRDKKFLDVSYLPAPAWEYLNVKKYFKNSGDRTLPVEGSRGCPYNCSYCCTYLSWGRRIRYKKVDQIVKELLETQEKFNPDCFHFVDDNLSFSKEWFKEFLNKLIDLGLPVKVDASNFSVKHIDEELVDLLIKADMNRVAMAVESGSKEIQERINKRLDFKKIEEAVAMVKSKNLPVHLCWMIGFPGETMEQINQTFNFARKLRAHSNQFLTVLPYPGTKLYEDAKEGGFLAFNDVDLDRFDNRKCEYLKSDEWNYEQIREMIYDINIEINFLNNPFLDTKEGEVNMLMFLEKLLLRLPEHVISHIIAGYIHKNKKDYAKCEMYYNSAVELLNTNKVLNDTFAKYLLLNHPIINDFNKYLQKNDIKIKGVKVKKIAN